MIQDNPVLHLTATTSGVVATTDGAEHDDNLYMPEDFFEGIKGARYSHYGQYISGYADSFEELLTVLERHAQVGGRGRGVHGKEGLICFVTTEEGPSGAKMAKQTTLFFTTLITPKIPPLVYSLVMFHKMC